jgi:hypothetical protein
MLVLTGSIEVATLHPLIAITAAITRQVNVPSGSTHVYVGSFFRFTALSGGRRGAFSEVLGFDDVWHTHDTFEETP